MEFYCLHGNLISSDSFTMFTVLQRVQKFAFSDSLITSEVLTLMQSE